VYSQRNGQKFDCPLALDTLMGRGRTMKNWFFLIVMMTCVSLPSLAESAAKKERDFSCTQYCTEGGDYAVNIKKHELTTLKVISDDQKREARFRQVCLKSSMLVPGNVCGCKSTVNKCLEGGLLSSVKGRKAKVESYVKELMAECDTAKFLFQVNSLD
jgi:hypothetical protein